MLRPCIPGLVESLLPGLGEGEGSEFYHPTMRVLTQLLKKVETSDETTRYGISTAIHKA